MVSAKGGSTRKVSIQKTGGEDEGVAMAEKPIEAISAGKGQSALLLAIESQIIPRLVLAHPTAPAVAPAVCDSTTESVRPSPAEITEFTGIVLRGRTDEAAAFMRALQERGVTTESLYLELLAPAARHFGLFWEAERSDFVEVTLALRRLQGLAHEFSAEFNGDDESPLSVGPRALCVALPGEQHVFGAQLVGEFLRRARWDVWDAPGATEQDIIALVEREWFTVVGVSISTTDQLDALAGLVRRLRRASLNPDLRVMVGGLPFEDHPERAALVGADATARDGRDAVAKANKLLELTRQRN
jgi:methanogenic corrinoid protein MtbC1